MGSPISQNMSAVFYTSALHFLEQFLSSKYEEFIDEYIKVIKPWKGQLLCLLIKLTKLGKIYYRCFNCLFFKNLWSFSLLVKEVQNKINHFKDGY